MDVGVNNHVYPLSNPRFHPMSPIQPRLVALTVDERAFALLVQRGPPDALRVQADPEHLLLLPVVVHREDGLLGRGQEDVQTAAEQAEKEQLRFNRRQQEGLA